jgi:hypothetical protein
MRDDSPELQSAFFHFVGYVTQTQLADKPLSASERYKGSFG